ncbi:MAG: glycine cleavage system protein GcvH [Promethearchaeota archaeon]
MAAVGEGENQDLGAGKTDGGTNTPFLVLPCGGAERATGLLASLAASKLVEASGGAIISEPSLPQLAAGPGRHLPAIRGAKVVVLDGCGQKCASKVVQANGVKPLATYTVATLLKGKDFHPEDPRFLSGTELELVPGLAEDLASRLSDLQGRAENAAGGPSSTLAFEPTFTGWFEHQKAKFTFKVPKKEGGLYFNWNDAWAYVEGGRAFVGITDYLQQNIGDVTFVELPEVGEAREILDSLATVETIKTAIDVVAPFSGKVVAVNDKLQDAPELVNQQPYAAGWICALELSDFEGELEDVMGPAEYFEFMRDKVEEQAPPGQH